MNVQKFTQKSLEAIQNAQSIALENQNAQIEQEHLMLALLEQEESLIKELLKKMGVSANFENTLKTELGRCKHESLDSKMKDVDLSRLNPSVYVDSSNYSYRLDGSNVDIDTEEVELASEQIRYQGITAGINGQFDRMRSVIK